MYSDDIILEFNDSDDLGKEIRCVCLHVCIQASRVRVLADTYSGFLRTIW